MGGSMRLVGRGSLAHRLLSVTSAEPRTVRELVDVLQKRQVPLTKLRNLFRRMYELWTKQLVQREGRGDQYDPFRYTLTPAGEQELDRLAEQEPVSRVVLQDYQHHIRQTHVDRQHLAHCGAGLAANPHGFIEEWVFTDIDHAFHTVQQGGRMQPCPACCAAVIKVLERAQ